MAKWDPAKAAAIEERVRAAVADNLGQHGYCPQTGDLADLFGVGRATVHDWFLNGWEQGGVRIPLRYWTKANGYRTAHPADVLVILDQTRKLRSADHPEGVPPGSEDFCPCCKQKLPEAGLGRGGGDGPSTV